jgi:hypothetical protein
MKPLLVSAVREANHLFKRDAGFLGIFAPQTKVVDVDGAQAVGMQTLFWDSLAAG